MSRIIRAVLSTAGLIGATLLMTTTAAAGSRGVCNSEYDVVVNPADFVDSAGLANRIDNPFMPLQPGTTYRYEGTLEGEAQVDIVEVTGESKTILGVAITVVHDTVSVNGVVTEDTFDWFAQDDLGNVWYFGEDTKEFDADGNVTSTAGSWEAGVNGAQPGIVMLAQPSVHVAYRQEYAPNEAEDGATVISLTEVVSVPFGSFSDVLQTKEFSCLESGSDAKFYAPDVGLVSSTSPGGKDVLELVEVTG
jgi:hypothetical protein